MRTDALLGALAARRAGPERVLPAAPPTGTARAFAEVRPAARGAFAGGLRAAAHALRCKNGGAAAWAVRRPPAIPRVVAAGGVGRRRSPPW